jgi:hypothetical protein
MEEKAIYREETEDSTCPYQEAEPFLIYYYKKAVLGVWNQTK